MLMANVDKAVSDKIENIVYIYDCWQPLYDELMKIRNIKFIEGIPDRLDDDILPVTKNNLLIFDDVMKDASNSHLLKRYLHNMCITATSVPFTWYRICFFRVKLAEQSV